MVGQNSNPGHLVPESMLSKCQIAMFSYKCHETEISDHFQYLQITLDHRLLFCFQACPSQIYLLHSYYCGLLKRKPIGVISCLKLQIFCIPCRIRSKCLSPASKRLCVGRSLLQTPQCRLPTFTLQQKEMGGGSSKHSMVSYLRSETHKLFLFCMGSSSPMLPQSLIPSRKYLRLITEILSYTKLSSEPHILHWVVCSSLH